MRGEWEQRACRGWLRRAGEREWSAGWRNGEWRWRLAWSLMMLACWSTWLGAGHGAEPGGVRVGQPAPAFKVQGIDGRTYTLESFAKAQVVVLVFTSVECPVASAYDARLVALAKRYGDRGVQLVAANVNAEARDVVRKRVEAHGFTFPYLLDPSQKLGRDFGASVTPQVFVLDRQRKVVYIGAFDDDADGGGSVRRKYVEEVVQDLLAGKPPRLSRTELVGCSILYD